MERVAVLPVRGDLVRPAVDVLRAVAVFEPAPAAEQTVGDLLRRMGRQTAHHGPAAGIAADVAPARARGGIAVGIVVLRVPLVVGVEDEVRPLARRPANLAARARALPAVHRGILVHAVVVVEVVVVRERGRVEVFVHAALDDAVSRELLAVAADAAAVVAAHVIVLVDLLEALGEEGRPALLILLRVRPPRLEVLTEVRLVELVRIVVVGVVLVPDRALDGPVVALVVDVEARVDDPLRAVLRVLHLVDVGVVGERQRDVRTQRHALADRNALRTRHLAVGRQRGRG